MSQEFEVEHILDFRGSHYLVKWLVFPLHQATWEPQSSLKENCSDLIDQFWDSVRSGHIILGEGFIAYKNSIKQKLRDFQSHSPLPAQVTQEQSCSQSESKLEVVHVQIVEGEVMAIVKYKEVGDAMGVARWIKEMGDEELDGVWAFLAEEI